MVNFVNVLSFEIRMIVLRCDSSPDVCLSAKFTKIRVGSDDPILIQLSFKLFVYDRKCWC